MMPDHGPVLIFDLDGTVLTINSFPRWAMFMLQGKAITHPGWKRRRLIASVLWLIICRKTRLMSHNTLQWRLQHLWQQAVRNDDGRAVARFIATLQPFVQPALCGLLADIASGGGDAVLATAAAGEYAVPLGRKLGFTHILATEPGRGPGSQANAMTQKRDVVLCLLRDQGWLDRERTLFTDHCDDLPLMAVCDTVYWFGSAAAGDRVKDALPQLRLQPGTTAHGITRPRVVA